MNVLVEICVDSPAGIVAAEDGGADRIELCSALDCGGLSPSPGLLSRAARAAIPVHALIRPHARGFVFGASDVESMMADIDAVREAGLAGVVIGAALPDGNLDIETLRQLCDRAAGLSLTLHRVFDLVPDPRRALEEAIDLGFTRLLTSGGSETAEKGILQLAALCRQAAGRICVMPGGGISASNVGRIVSATGAVEVHASCRSVQSVPVFSERYVALGFGSSESLKMTSKERVQELKASLSLSN